MESPSPAFIFHQLLRYKDLCPGASQCPEVLMMEEPAPGDALPCPFCPAQLLQDYMGSTVGRMITDVIDLDFALQSRVQVRLEEIPYTHFLLLRTFTDEREKWRTEEMDKLKRRG